MNKKYTEYKNLNLIELSNAVLDYWDKNKTFQQSVGFVKAKHPLFSMKDLHLPTENLVFTTLWLVPLKISFVVTKPKKDFM